MKYKVYITLGFHTSFYHSWRGDTPDEAGFGTDIRIVRRILEILNDANNHGLQACGYWDFDIYWTLEKILPKHAPDIITGIRDRVQAGMDEVLPGPYNNGANHAATEEELRAAIAWSLENPHGSGLRQLFGQVTPVYRPQECMYTAGQNRILREEGIDGIILYYAGVPFNTLSTFIPPLTPEQRYNPLLLRSLPEEEPLLLLPCISVADIFNHTSFEIWLLELRELQTSGKVRSDMLLHLNEDADMDTWLPMGLPRALSWFPNTGGLPEIIRAVNKYSWAEFTTPGKYIRSHPPFGEILVRQDLADGGFDGSYSWTEKYTSLMNWTGLEQSRLHTRRAEALAANLAPENRDAIHRKLWLGVDSSFFSRLVGLTTTHFGMSTPIINEERQAKAVEITETALHKAIEAEQDAAVQVCENVETSETALYAFEVFSSSDECGQSVIRVPLLLPPGIDNVEMLDTSGVIQRSSLVNVEELSEGWKAGDLMFSEILAPGERKLYQVRPGILKNHITSCLPTLANRWLHVDFSEKCGIEHLLLGEEPFGETGFLDPFVTYRSAKKPQCWKVQDYQLKGLVGESWQGIQRARLRSEIAMETPGGKRSTNFEFTFILFDDLPFLIADVLVNFAYTQPTDIIHNMQQKLRRLIDLRWVETAPFQIRPSLGNQPGEILRVWKRNYLGVTSFYDLNYGRINPLNRDLDSFNHHVTAGWVAVSSGKKGLLVAENAEHTSSMAFCPMRLRELEGRQQVWLNPFGSYYGNQFDYSHIDPNSLGVEMTLAVSGALKPNGPSFNGQSLHFSLLLALYLGDEPPQDLQLAANNFFYPPGVIYLKSPQGVDLQTGTQMRETIDARRRALQSESSAPLLAPTAFLANPVEKGSVLVWEHARDARVSGYEIEWFGGEKRLIPTVDRWTVEGLENGVTYSFRVRARSGDLVSPWTEAGSCTPGAVREVKVLSEGKGLRLGTIVKLVRSGLRHAWVTGRGKQS
ncbi:MAG: fibronectin type III domain-containing protein [Chloroflexi bacterium]|nr:MAG: fibronectin type III domain-containing protein [Chloroflexota bacterium]